MENQKLTQYFKFDESDLQANRNGKISAAQQAHIKSDSGSGHILVLFLGLVILAATSTPLISTLRSSQTTTPTEWLFAAASLLIGLGIDAWLLRRVRMKEEYQVGKVEGRVNIVTTSGNHTTYYELHVGGQKFDVDEDISDVMNQGDACIVYYIKEYNDVLSVE
jgi:hypothetical protein